MGLGESANTVNAHLLLTARVHEEDGQWVSECEELGVASFGASVTEALSALDEAIEVYLQTLLDIGELQRTLVERQIRIIPGNEQNLDASGHRRDDLVTEREVPVPAGVA